MAATSFLALLLVIYACADISELKSDPVVVDFEEVDGAPKDSSQTIDVQTEEVTPPRVVYGNDDRLDFFELPDSSIFKNIVRQSIVGLMSTSSLGTPVSGVYTFLNGAFTTLQQSQNLCSNQKFLKDPIKAFCSGTLVSPNQIVTAGHCITSTSDCASTAFVFGYYVTGRSSTGVPSFPAITTSDVYFCSSFSRALSGNLDFAVITLTTNVLSSKYVPVSIRTATSLLPVGTAVTLIGCPSGIPVKVASNAAITVSDGAGDGNYFQATVDAFAGNSGSGVFTSDGVDVGILVRGNQDYASSGTCNIVNVLSNTFSSSEEITYLYRAGLTAPPSSASSTTSTSTSRSKTTTASVSRGLAASASTTSSASATKSRSRSVSASQSPSPIRASVSPSRSLSPSSSPTVSRSRSSGGGPAGRSIGPLACGQTVTGTTVGRASSFGFPTGDAIYTVTPTFTGIHRFWSCDSSIDTFVRVLAADGTQLAGCDDLSDCGCSSCCASSRSAVLTVQLTQGQTVFVLVEGFSSNGAYSLFLSCGPAAARARGIVTCGSSVSVITSSLPSFFSQASGDAIYAVRAPASKTFNFRTCNSNFDTVATLISTTGSVIASCDDSSDCSCGSVCCSTSSRASLRRSISANSNVHLVVDGFGTATGTAAVSVSCA